MSQEEKTQSEKSQNTQQDTSAPVQTNGVITNQERQKDPKMVERGRKLGQSSAMLREKNIREKVKKEQEEEAALNKSGPSPWLMLGIAIIGLIIALLSFIGIERIQAWLQSDENSEEEDLKPGRYLYGS